MTSKTEEKNRNLHVCCYLFPQRLVEHCKKKVNRQTATERCEEHVNISTIIITEKLCVRMKKSQSWKVIYVSVSMCSMQQYAPLVLVQCKKVSWSNEWINILYSNGSTLLLLFFFFSFLFHFAMNRFETGLCIYANVGTKIKHRIACKI